MKILTKSLFLAALMLIANSCNNEELKTIETNKNLSYQESLIYAQKLNNELSTFLGDIDLSKQKINESVLVQDFIKNHANETISSLLSLGKNERVAYEGNYSNSNLRIDDLNELELSAIEKSYLIGLYEAASSEDSEKIIEILESFKENINKNPELENLNLIFSFIETNQSNLLAHKKVQRRTPNKSKNCSEAAETGGIIGGVFGMIKGA